MSSVEDNAKEAVGPPIGTDADEQGGGFHDDRVGTSRVAECRLLLRGARRNATGPELPPTKAWANGGMVE